MGVTLSNSSQEEANLQTSVLKLPVYWQTHKGAALNPEMTTNLLVIECVDLASGLT